MPDPTWDLTDQDCDAWDLGWSGTAVAPGTVSLVTEDGRSCYKLYTTGADTPYVVNTSLIWDSNITTEMVIKIISTANFISIYGRDSSRYQSGFRSYISALYGNYGRISINSPSSELMRGFIDIDSEWHTYRLVVKDDYFTVWVDRKLFYFNFGPIDTVNTESSANTVGAQTGVTGGAEASIYIDSIKISSTPKEPDATYPLKIHNQTIVSHIAQTGVFIDGGNATEYTLAEALRYNKNGTTYGFPLVATNNSQASAVRIYNGSVVKALMKLPLF